MRPIHKFILHVVHSWPTKLNEAIGKVQMDDLVNKFKKDAEDFNIEITDEQLKKYIEVFDRVKEKLPSDQKDIGKWSLSRLIKLATGVKGSEADDAEEIDITPDVVYNNDDNTIVIYNGSKEGNCISYGKGEKWCITRGSFGSYRYSQSRNYPTFYLAKNNNLSTDDRLSFVAIQVRDPNNYRDGRNYVFTNRKNSPYESEEMSFEELLRKVPWLQNIPNLKSILKYIPLSTKEKVGSQYKYSAISYNEWTKLPYKIKEQYLVVRRSNDNLFNDVTAEKFVEKYLPKYPEIANFVAVSTPGEGENPIIKYSYLLQNLDKFSSPIQKSIVANIRQKIDPAYLSSVDFPFEQKKKMVERDLWNTSDRMYVTKDGSTIVKLNFRGEDVEMSLYQEDDSYPKVKLNQRTSKYLREYPELDKVPLNVLLKLVQDNVVGAEFVGDILKKAKEDPNSALIVKEMEDGSEIILDSNAFSSYKIENGTIKKIPFTDKEVQQVFNDAKDNEKFQQNALNLFKDITSIPSNIDVNSLRGVINSIPYNQRIITTRNNPSMPVVLLTSDGDDEYFFTSPSSISGPFYRATSEYNRNGRASGYGNMTPSKIPAYHAYLRSINKSFNDQDLQNILGNNGINFEGKVAAARDGIPVNADNVYKVVYDNNTDMVMLINTENSRQSLTLSRARNNLKQFNIPQGAADIYLGRTPAQVPGQAAAQPAAGATRRGRPAGVPNAPRPQQAQPVAAGDLSLSTVANQWGLTPGFNSLPRTILRKFRVNGRQVPVANNRGASARNNTLGNRGRVTTVYEFGPSAIYIIRLPNDGPEGQRPPIASVVAQPGNNHYIVTNNNAYPLGSPRELLQVLQQRNLAEIHQYIVNEYLERNPSHLTEFKELLRKHINEKKK
jgi:hypothetical protein